jgi:hypothetical protein
MERVRLKLYLWCSKSGGAGDLMAVKWKISTDSTQLSCSRKIIYPDIIMAGFIHQIYLCASEFNCRQYFMYPQLIVNSRFDSLLIDSGDKEIPICLTVRSVGLFQIFYSPLKIDNNFVVAPDRCEQLHWWVTKGIFYTFRFPTNYSFYSMMSAHKNPQQRLKNGETLGLGLGNIRI